MDYESGFEVLKQKERLPEYECPDPHLRTLLEGHFRKDLLYLFYGPKKVTADILIDTAVYSFKNGEYDEKIALIDAYNRFNPYEISKQAVRIKMSPTKVPQSIFISRTFTWEQTVELLEEKIKKLENLKILLISGITKL